MTGPKARAGEREGEGEGEITLWLGGDLHLGGGDPAAILAAIAGLVPAGARGVVNLEGPIGAAPAGVGRPSPARGSSAGSAALRSDEVGDEASDPAAAAGEAVALPTILTQETGVAAALASLGITAVGVANNHADDLGPSGRATTIASLRAAGITPIGGDAGVARLTLGDVRLAITAHDLSRGVDGATIDADLRGAGEGAEVVIATFHTAGPPSYLPRPELRQAAAIAVAAGAQVVVAHGSHAIARIERQGPAVIAWGLGNLAFACTCTDEVDAAILLLRIDRRGVRAAEWVPIEAGLAGAPVRAAADPGLALDLLRALGSAPGRRLADRLVLDLDLE